MQRLLRVITDTNVLESEFLEYQAYFEFPAYFDEGDKPVRMNQIWHQISKQIDLYSGQLQFKHFSEFANFLLFIPHSNSYCESTFSTNRKICTDSRHNRCYTRMVLVYTWKQHRRENILGILIPKINIFGKKKLACYELEPKKFILAQAKSATYKTLQARKTQQQQAAATDDVED